MCFFHRHFALNKASTRNAKDVKFIESVRTQRIGVWNRKSMRGSNLGLFRSHAARTCYQPFVLIEGCQRSIRSGERNPVLIQGNEKHTTVTPLWSGRFTKDD